MKLEDIPKKQVFNVPDGYFDQLPGKIQSRISDDRRTEESFVFRYKLQYVIPVIFVFAIGLLWLIDPQQPNDAEAILAEVETEYLVAYLTESELTTEDLVEEAGFSSDEIQDIEMDVYQLQLEDKAFDNVLDAIDVESL